MKAALRELLTEIVDYAGLFPPAALEFDPAIRNYARYRADPDAWVLGRFICPAARLAALTPYDRELFHTNPPIDLSVLGTGAPRADAFIATLETDLQAMRRCAETHADRLALDAFEVRLPADVTATGDAGAIRGLLQRVDKAFESAGFDGAARFFEPALDDNWQATVDCVVAALATHNYGESSIANRDAKAGQDAEPAHTEIVLAPPWRSGFKLRTGGLEAASFPAPEIVAYVIEQCRDHNLPLKFTAGLHHPVRCYDASLRATMHGFLNLFCASVLAHALAFDLPDIRAVVEEEDASTFDFGDQSLRWNDAEAMLDEIRFVRSDRCLSFGSCSFDEPRDDLRALHLL